MPGEIREDWVIREDEVFRDVSVGRDYAIRAHSLKGSLGAGSPGNPAHEHDVTVRRVLDRLGAEVGNEVEQIDDAFGILLRPTDRTRGLRPIAGDVRHRNRRHPGQYAVLVGIEPRFSPILDPVWTAEGQFIVSLPRRHQNCAGCSYRSGNNASTRDTVYRRGHELVSSVTAAHAGSCPEADGSRFLTDVGFQWAKCSVGWRLSITW